MFPRVGIGMEGGSAAGGDRGNTTHHPHRPRGLDRNCDKGLVMVGELGKSPASTELMQFLVGVNKNKLREQNAW